MTKVTRSTESPNFCSVVYVAREGTYLDDTLAHHGILKQRWGIRRWQNEDGSLTEAGKRRYGRVENLNANRTLKDIAKDQKLTIKLERANKKLAIQRAKQQLIEVKKTNEQNKTAIKKTKDERRRIDLDAKEHEEAKRLAEKNRKKAEAEKIAAEKERKAAEKERKAEEKEQARKNEKLRKEQEREEAKALKEAKRKRSDTSKKASLMTDMELNDAIARLRKERELKNLSKSDARLFIEDIAKTTIKNTVIDIATTTTKTLSYFYGAGGKDNVGMEVTDVLKKSFESNLKKTISNGKGNNKSDKNDKNDKNDNNDNNKNKDNS